MHSLHLSLASVMIPKYATNVGIYADFFLFLWVKTGPEVGPSRVVTVTSLSMLVTLVIHA